MANSIKILGIDPGSLKTGYGLIEYSDKRNIHIASGCIKLNQKDSLADRLLVLSMELDKLITDLNPDLSAVEKIFYSKNAQSALTLGHARGVILLKLAEHKLPINEYPPLIIKKTVVGVGRADKSQVKHMVKILLNLKHKLQEDEADALAVAITSAHLMT